MKNPSGSSPRGLPGLQKVVQYGAMLPAQVSAPFHRDGWVYEEKIDGWRMLAYKDGKIMRLESRDGVDHTTRFPDLAAAVPPYRDTRWCSMAKWRCSTASCDPASTGSASLTPKRTARCRCERDGDSAPRGGKEPPAGTIAVDTFSAR